MCSTFSFLNICACCKELMFNYQRHLDKELNLSVLFVFVLFYFILFEKEGCWYCIAMSPWVSWNHKGLETIWRLSDPPCFLVLFLTWRTCETKLSCVLLPEAALVNTRVTLNLMQTFLLAIRATLTPEKTFLLKDMFHYCQCFYWALL